MTRFGLLLTSDGFASQSLASVLLFARTAVQHNHCIDHIFLYQDAVYCAADNIDLPADEPDLSAELASFCQQLQIPLLFCVTAAEKRGVVSDTLAARAGYTGAGLAELAMRQSNIDKLVQF
ncbi:MAG TPA: DsrE family protein [Rheinheimera sp.]|nr:DsrE family protein [Rheinheimera sp.]